MSLTGIAEVVAFALSAFIAIAGALGMATTMSMFRSAIFLMASFMGVAGLFILLSADLLALLQIMMYIGGMLVMVLFMVLFMHDPGGAMMASMPKMMTPVEKFFSLGLVPRRPHDGARDKDHGEHRGHAEERHPGTDHHDHHEPCRDAGDGEAHADSGHGGMEHMDMADMSMVTPVRSWAALIALATGGALVALLILRSSWPTSRLLPDSHSARQVGSLLMDKYMIGFEGAGFLILIGIVGAVLAARSGRHPDRSDRQARVAVDAPPSEIEADVLASASQHLLRGQHDTSGGSE